MTPRTIKEVPVRHGAAVRRPAGPAALYGRYRERQPLLGGHEQQRAAWPSTRRPESRRPVHPEPDRPARADRERIDLCHRRSRRRVHEVLRGHGRERVPRRARCSSAGRTPGATTTATSTRTARRPTQRREHLHRVVEHRRRRGPSAVGHEGRRPARRSAERVQGLRVRTCSTGTPSVGAFLIAESGTPWESLELRALQRLDAPRRATRFATRSRRDRAAPTATSSWT